MNKPSAKLSSLNIGDEVRIGGDRYTVRDQPEPPRVAVPPSTCRYGPMCHAVGGAGWICHCPRTTDNAVLDAAHRAARMYVTSPQMHNPPTPEQMDALLSALSARSTETAQPVAAPVRAFPSAAIDPAFGGMELRDWFAGQAMAGWLASIPADTCHPASNDATDDADSAAIAELSYIMADAMMFERERPCRQSRRTQSAEALP